jgi:hypothetical protein
MFQSNKTLYSMPSVLRLALVLSHSNPIKLGPVFSPQGLDKYWLPNRTVQSGVF